MEMILPMKWHHMYVPNLPHDMIEAADESFMPYIVGIQKKYLSELNTTDRIVIDVDEDSCKINTKLH